MTFRRPVLNFFVTLHLALAGPALAQTDTLDSLFDKLAEAEPEEAGRIEGQIAAQWSKSGSAAMDLLLRRGEDALEAGDFKLAAEHFTAAIDHAPDFAEAYNGRATAYYLQGLIGPSLDDLRRTLDLNPRHFAAMRGLAILLEELGRPEDALEVYGEIRALHPHLDGVEAAMDRLELELTGQTL